MTKTKYEIGSQWRTRGGWRAVVVTHEADGLLVWHSNTEKTCKLYYDGCLEGNAATAWDLIEPWKEPKRGVAYVNIYDKDVFSYPYETRAEADRHVLNNRLACVKVEWKEGQQDE